MNIGQEEQRKLESGSYVLIPKGERWLRYISLVSVISLIFSMGVFSANSKGKMFNSPEEKARTINHAKEDTRVYGEAHQTITQLQSEFVTRREYDMIVKGQDEIKEMIRDLSHQK